MIKMLYSTLFLTLIFSLQCKESAELPTYPETILLDADYLFKNKARIKENDPQIKPAFDMLIREAEKAMHEGPFSVTDKKQLPPSGDKHDYASYSRYWWPDPNQPDGLPYIRRDGETNPESQNLAKSDRQRIGALGNNTETLGLAYYLTGDIKYAKKAAELLRVWFINPSTRMNANVNHAQCRPGHNLGYKSGVLDGRVMIMALEGSRLIAHSSALSDPEMDQLKAWATEYFEWLTSSEMALEESRSKNNHGSYYDVQALYFALYSGNTQAAIEISKNFTSLRLHSQITPEGSMPEEMARTRPLFYSVYNLHAMLLVAHLAEQVNVDIWNVQDKDSRLRRALDFLAPYADPEKKWPQPTIGTFDRMELFTILQMASQHYPNSNYMKEAEKLPIESRKTHRSNLTIPLMR